jgi:hypothetical protein
MIRCTFWRLAPRSRASHAPAAGTRRRRWRRGPASARKSARAGTAATPPRHGTRRTAFPRLVHTRDLACSIAEILDRTIGASRLESPGGRSMANPQSDDVAERLRACPPGPKATRGGRLHEAPRRRLTARKMMTTARPAGRVIKSHRKSSAPRKRLFRRANLRRVQMTSRRPGHSKVIKSHQCWFRGSQIGSKRRQPK